VLVAIYYLLPLDHTSTWIAATTLVIGLVAFIALVIFQVRSIIRSRFPGLRAVEALATSLPLFLLLFSATYLVMATVSANASARLREHPARHRLLDLAPVLVSAAIWICPHAAMRHCLETGNQMTECEWPAKIRRS
jgi:hypothetical protein